MMHDVGARGSDMFSTSWAPANDKHSGMNHFSVERRRTLRAAPPDGRELTLDISLPVEMLDISLSGVQLASRAPLKVGERAELRASIGSRAISLMIEVRRVAPAQQPSRGGARYRVGATFDPMSVEQRLALEQVVGMERS
jgi:hypothetical protein